MVFTTKFYYLRINDTYCFIAVPNILQWVLVLLLYFVVSPGAKNWHLLHSAGLTTVGWMVPMTSVVHQVSSIR